MTKRPVLLAATLALVAAVILAPHAPEASAQASGPATDDLGGLADLELLDRVLLDYRSALGNATGEDLEYIMDGIGKLELARQVFVHASAAPGSDQPSAVIDEYNGETARLLDLFKYDVPSETLDGDGIVTGGQAAQIINRHSDTHMPSQYDCQERRSVKGKAVGVVTQFSNGQTVITGTFAFPEDFHKQFTQRRASLCDEFDHNKAWMRYNVLLDPVPGGYIQPMTCPVESTMPVGTDSTRCNALVKNRIVTVITGSEYESLSGKKTQLGNLQITAYLS